MNHFLTAAALVTLCLFVNDGWCGTGKGEKIDGKKEFETHCAVCHPKGGNIVNAKKPLFSRSLKANGIKSSRDIIDKMRNPGPGMTKFDESTISEKKALAIADYIRKAFK